MQNNYKTINGYIEGYYGRLLNWEERYRIITQLKKNKMNFYFYAPKEDEKHRLNWKKNYDLVWKNEFQQFCKNAKINKIKIIIGLSPGLNFDFQDFQIKKLQNRNSRDFKILINKSREFLKYGAVEIALLFDDLPNNFRQTYGKSILEGKTHAELTNQLSKVLKKSIYVVPRIYADQLIDEDKNYLLDYGTTINQDNITFYSGQHIVSKNLNRNTLNKIKKVIPTKVVIWDNFYANDYCPRRLFLGPLIGRSEVDDIMINPTGLIETDLLILDIVKATKKSVNKKIDWEKILKKHKVPKHFLNISMFFLKPDFGDNPSIKKIYINNKNIDSLDYLLWKWKTPLSREWFPFLLGLKHDLQLYKRDLTSDRIIKTQTQLLANYILKI